MKNSESGTIYSSSDPTHASGTEYDWVTRADQCPNEPPEWYEEFLDANTRDRGIVPAQRQATQDKSLDKRLQLRVIQSLPFIR